MPASIDATTFVQSRRSTIALTLGLHEIGKTQRWVQRRDNRVRVPVQFNDDNAPVYSAFFPCERRDLFKWAIAL